MEQLPKKCPNCGDELYITALECGECGTNINGIFQPDIFSKLSGEEFQFVISFLKARGNIKQVEKDLNISYPTVRSKLEGVLEKLNLTDIGDEGLDRMEILKRVEDGEITTDEAVGLFKKLKTKKEMIWKKKE